VTRQIRERQEIRPGDDFLLFELSNGDLLLRRSRPPKKSLAWHLRRLGGGTEPPEPGGCSRGGVVKWLLDTNTLSELTKPRPFPGLLEWLEVNEADSALSTISIGEMILGIERLPESKKRRRLQPALDFLRQGHTGKILDFTEGVAVEWGRLVAEARNQGRSLAVLDSQIEATAVHYGLMVVSRNGADFFNPRHWRCAPHSCGYFARSTCQALLSVNVSIGSRPPPF
jgi:predicted nucleic acid-binding protein